MKQKKFEKLVTYLFSNALNHASRALTTYIDQPMWTKECFKTAYEYLTTSGYPIIYFHTRPIEPEDMKTKHVAQTVGNQNSSVENTIKVTVVRMLLKAYRLQFKDVCDIVWSDIWYEYLDHSNKSQYRVVDTENPEPFAGEITHIAPNDFWFEIEMPNKKTSIDPKTENQYRLTYVG